MAKKRTGLQSNISSIFSGVPIPKKGRPDSEQPEQKKPDGSSLPKPPVPQPRTAPPKPAAQPGPAAPAVQPIPVIPPAQAPPPAVPPRKVRRVPKKVARRKKDRALTRKAQAGSKRQKVSIALVVLLSVVLVVVLVRPFGTVRRRPAADRNPGQTARGIEAMANVRIDWPEPPAYPADLRDPTLPPSQQETGVQKADVLVVTAITLVYNEQKQEWEKIAVVGIEMLGEGDMVPDTRIKVKKIEPDRVEFEDETGKTWTQTVQGQDNSTR